MRFFLSHNIEQVKSLIFRRQPLPIRLSFCVPFIAEWKGNDSHRQSSWWKREKTSFLFIFPVFLEYSYIQVKVPDVCFLNSLSVGATPFWSTGGLLKATTKNHWKTLSIPFRPLIGGEKFIVLSVFDLFFFHFSCALFYWRESIHRDVFSRGPTIIGHLTSDCSANHREFFLFFSWRRLFSTDSPTIDHCKAVLYSIRRNETGKKSRALGAANAQLESALRKRADVELTEWVVVVGRAPQRFRPGSASTGTSSSIAAWRSAATCRVARASQTCADAEAVGSAACPRAWPRSQPSRTTTQVSYHHTSKVYSRRPSPPPSSHK